MTDFILSAFADEAADTLEGQLAALKRNELSHIELRNIDGRSVIDFSDAELSALAGTLKANGISVSAIASPIGKISVEEEFEPHFARFCRAVHAALILGTHRIRIFSFYPPEGANPEDSFEAVIQRLQKLCGYASEYGVHCCHENEKEIYGDTAERVKKLHQRMGNSMDAVFDPANFVQCGVHPASAYPTLAPYIAYLHIKDALFYDGSVVPAGKGDGDITEVLALYHRQGTGRLLTVEPHLFDFGGLSGLQTEQLLHQTIYANADEAFDTAVCSLKQILKARGDTYA